jgi:hypothetical protein
MSKKAPSKVSSKPKQKTLPPKQRTIDAFTRKEESSDELETWKEYKIGLAPLPRVGKPLIDMFKESSPAYLRNTYAHWVKNDQELPEIHVYYQMNELDTKNVTPLMKLEPQYLPNFLKDRDDEISKIKDSRNIPYDKNDPKRRPITDHRYLMMLLNKNKNQTVASQPKSTQPKPQQKKTKENANKQKQDSISNALFPYNAERFVSKEKLNADKKHCNEVIVDPNGDTLKLFLDLSEVAKLLNFQEKGELIRKYVPKPKNKSQCKSMNQMMMYPLLNPLKK